MKFLICPSVAYDDDWVPLEIQQLSRYRVCANLNDAGTEIVTYYPRAMREMASFAAMWAKNIRDQHWLQRGIVVPD